MGLLSLLKGMRKEGKEMRVLMLGLDNAGKTTILRALSGEDHENVMPTQGFNVKSIQHENMKLNVWDIGGQQTIRTYWSNYFENCDALVYVVDSSDTRRLEESSLELQDLMKEENGLLHLPILVFANKQDIEGACSADDVNMALQVTTEGGHASLGRNICITGCSAKSGHGISEGMEWIIGSLGGDQEQ